MIFEAIDFAANAHRGTYRKITRVPYLNHPLRVAQILIEHGFEEEPLAVAAILHDTVEDSDTTACDLQQQFGPEVAGLVDWVTVPDRVASWRQRKDGFLRRLETAPFDVLVLAGADKLDNVRSLRADIGRIGELVWQALTVQKEEQRWYYRSAAAVLIRRLVKPKGKRFRWNCRSKSIASSAEDMVMKKRREVGDLSFTEEEQRELLQQEEDERSRQSTPPEPSPPTPPLRPEAPRASWASWLRFIR